MLLRLRQLEKIGDQGTANKIGINPVAIEISLIMALIHVILEGINLIIEAKTWKVPLRGYMIACHNAKQGWIAQSTAFISTDKENKEQDKMPIKFDENTEQFCGQGFSVNFNFTDLSIEFLINIISNLPKIEDSHRRNTIELGQCISDLSVNKFRQLLKLSFQKINIVFVEPEINLIKIFNNFEFKKKLTNPQLQEGDSILVDMVRMNYHQVVKVLINLGAKADIRTPENESLLQIAFNNHYRETMKELLQLNKNNEKYVKESLLEREMFYDELFLRDDKK